LNFTIRPYILSLIFAFFLLLMPSSSWGQDYMSQVQCFGMEEGLSNNTIHKIFQDSRGVVWIGTLYGLNRFDGTSIKVYNKKQLGLPEDWITEIYEDENHMLWISSRSFNSSNTTSIFDPITEKNKDLKEYTGSSSEDLIISPIYNETNMLIQRTDSTYIYYQLNSEQSSLNFTIKKETLDSVSAAYKMAQDTFVIYRPGKKIFVNSSGEILLLDDEDVPKRRSIEKIISKKNISYSFDGDTLNVTDISEKLLEKKVLDVKTTNEKNFIRQKVIILDDAEGNIWFPSLEGSICILSLKKQSFNVEAFGESATFRTRGIVKTANGIINASGSSFDVSIENKDGVLMSPYLLFQKAATGNRTKRLSTKYYGVLEAKGNNLWAATRSDLVYFNTKKETSKHYRSDVNPIDFWQPYKSPDGTIWCGTTRGIQRLDTLTKKMIRFNDFSDFPFFDNSIVYAFYLNDKGTWLSTSKGLFLVDLKQEKIIAHYSDSQEGDFFIPTDNILHLHEDKAGIFWLATQGNGLIRWDPETNVSEVFTKANAGLSHNVLYAVYEDDFDNLWIPSSWGLMSFNKITRLVATYFKEDGIPNNEFNTISHHQDKEGNLYFGTQNGFIHFHPKDFVKDKKDFPFILTACNKESLENDSISKLIAPLLESHELNFYPSDKSINLSFAYLDYQNLKNIQYSYKIEGYHKDWIYQKESVIKVIGLPYGTYQLTLRAKSAGSQYWQEYSKHITINVKKPFYLQWWFIASSLLTLALLLVYFIRRRTQKLITQKQELEQIVAKRTAKIEEQNEELRSLDKVKSNFFANISHELRTPLTLILGPLSYVLDSPGEWNKEDVQKQLLVMQRNGKSLLELIEEILDLSKLEANKMKLEEEATSIREFFEHIFTVFEPQFQSLGIDYDLNFELKNPDQFILLDRKKMEKVLNNFLSNAIKFTPKGNRITLLISETEDQLNIKVSDTGKGVHPNDLPFIFERFYQSKQEDQKLYGGTGIGLALVNEFAELMGGKAYAESTLGVGSQFYFELPLKPVSVENFVSKSAITIVNSEFEEEPIDRIGTDFTILVVEDNEDMRNFICQLLESRYKKVLQAKNGAEGLEQLAKHGLDIRLVVSDVMMPEVDGLTMLKEIKRNKEWAGIPVVMLTALAAERDKLAALTIGVDDYLTKPFSVTELLARVQNLLYNYHQREEWQKSQEYLQIESVDQIETVVPKTSGQDGKWVNEIEKFIKGSVSSGIPDVETVAVEFNLSIRQFNRKLKEITGLSTAKFIKEVQLQKARKELENGSSLSVKEVAFNNGFELPSTFSKLFKIRFGKSPSEYLKNRGVADLS
jgi:signal transduction histidine kinase/CheY-like chemotaxis protein